MCARQLDGQYDPPVDLDRIMVRARLHSHLAALQARFSDELGGCEILDSAGTDHRREVRREARQRVPWYCAWRQDTGLYFTRVSTNVTCPQAVW